MAVATDDRPGASCPLLHGKLSDTALPGEITASQNGDFITVPSIAKYDALIIGNRLLSDLIDKIKSRARLSAIYLNGRR